jgi:hypothetical protein
VLQLLGAAAAALPWRPSLAAAQAAPLTESSVLTLRQIAPVVLPSELGVRGADAVVDSFLAWLRGYRSSADMGFGYGILRQRRTPQITAATYVQQLEALSRAGAGTRGAASNAAARAAIVKSLDDAGIKDFPSSPNGTHVVADFMSFYFNGTDANDLCFKAKIGRDRCRTLAGSSQRPAPLEKA